MEIPSKKVFITGLSGFTGIHLSKYLIEIGYQVFGLGSNEYVSIYNSKKLDILDQDLIVEFLTQVQPDYIIHLAGKSFVGHKVPFDFYKVNVLGTESLLNSIIQAKINVQKVILASSATVYGQQDNFVLSENMMPNPVQHYGISKLAMELISKTYFDKLPIIITRPFNYTGTQHSLNFLIPKIISHFIDKKETIELGNIDTFREYNDIDWVCDIYHKLMLSDFQSDIVNICSGQTYSIDDIIQTATKISNHSIEVKSNPEFVRANEIKELKGCTKKLFSIVNSQTKNNLENLISKMLT